VCDYILNVHVWIGLQEAAFLGGGEEKDPLKEGGKVLGLL
jgi:hypothetical protein